MSEQARSQQIADLESENAQLRRDVARLVQALCLTHQYVGWEVLPPVPGWDWFDVLAVHAPEYVEMVKRSREAK